MSESFYPVAGFITPETLRRLGATETEREVGVVLAISDYEFRCPRRGEYYLAGDVKYAYYAHADVPIPFFIARLVKVEVVKTYKLLADPFKETHIDQETDSAPPTLS